MSDVLRYCPACGKLMADRVEEEERTGTAGSLSTGRCDTYRIWSCIDAHCVMFGKDVFREQLADAP